MVKIGQASRDERGRYSGGTAGDQDGKEVAIRGWYNRPWNKLLRAKKAVVREKIATAMETACANDKIGYDQGQRTTLYKICRANGFNISDISEPCETDCSALVAVCVNAAGIYVSGDIYTGNEAAALMATGEFELLTEPKYLVSDEYVKRGDILLYEFHHTAVVLENGNKAKESAPVNKYVMGWNRNGTGWWYVYDDKDNYHINNAVRINNKLYFFDSEGYCVKNPTVSTQESGELIHISGERVK
jgi:hypothetical protein|nr:MAG TPA: peptidoglycan hydrolase [Caudoviricetes sp.]